VKRADVLMENFRVGVLDRLGFPVSGCTSSTRDWWCCRSPASGTTAGGVSASGYDQIAQGEGGLMSITGTELPTKVGVPIADLLAGMNGRTAWWPRCTSAPAPAVGRVVRTSLLAGWSACTRSRAPAGRSPGEVPGWPETTTRSIAPYGMFATGSAPIQIACGSEGLWRAFAAEFGLDPAEPRFATNPERVSHRDELVEVIEAMFADSRQSTGSSGWRRRGCPPARCGPSTTSTAGSRPARRAC
jgi:crotonobetainyl-CoA:carnitine CoA-transferase CaiB-like acyl-CoA transferase